MVNLAVHVIEQKSGHFDPKELAGDRYQKPFAISSSRR